LKEQGVGDLQWVEDGLRAALHQDGRTLLENLLAEIGGKTKDDWAREGEKFFADRSRTIQSLFGPIVLRRSYYYNGAKRAGCCGRCPLDRALGLIGDYTPSLARLASRAVAQSPYAEASADLAAYAGVTVSGRQLQRLVQNLGPQINHKLKRLPRGPAADSFPFFYVVADGTGVPMVKRELVGVASRSAPMPARTREVKLGCIFTQSTTDEEGRPVRDEASTTYVAAFCEASHFGTLLAAEARQRYIERAQRVIVIGDGALWIWEMARVNFPGATEIIDFYHACEHLAALARLLEGANAEPFSARYHRWREQLKTSELSAILEEARQALHTVQFPTHEQALSEIAYFEKNLARMDYASFRAQGLFIGSGVVEAGCKILVGQRLKNSGMFWSQPGAQNLLSLRVALKSMDRFDQFWKAHAVA
jgi:hypothetical protein